MRLAKATIVPDQSMRAVRKTSSIVDENQESFRFYTLLRRDCVEEHVTVNRQESKCRLYLGRAMASLLAVLEDLRVSSRYGNRRAFQKTQRRMYDCKTLNCILNCIKKRSGPARSRIMKRRKRQWIKTTVWPVGSGAVGSRSLTIVRDDKTF